MTGAHSFATGGRCGVLVSAFATFVFVSFAPHTLMLLASSNDREHWGPPHRLGDQMNSGTEELSLIHI